MKTKVVCLVADSHQRKMAQVRKSLGAAGLKKVRVQETIGTISGEIEANEEEAKRKLNAVDGVAHVDISESYRLPPPDSDVQ